MSLRDVDWKVIQGAIIVLLISLLISISIIATTRHYKVDMLTFFKDSKQSFQNISRKYLAVDEEERLIKEYYSQFIALYNKGVVGPERRLNWIETLRSSGERIQLPDMRYVIESQSEYVPDYTLTRGGFQVYSSVMKLSIGLLHEGDLVRVLDDLNKNALGLYNVSRCTLKRRSETVKEDITQPNVSAECELRWFNIKKSGGKEINLS